MKRKQEATGQRNCGAGARGAVLFEVVLALVLFAAAAAVIGVGLNASIGSVERLRLSARAGDLSVTVFSELQLGVRSLADAGPEAFGQDLPGWTWELTVAPWGGAESSAAPLTHVEVIIRNENAGFVHRAGQVMRLQQPEPGAFAANPQLPKGLAVR